MKTIAHPIAFAVAVVVSSGVAASPNLITNGSFEQTTNGLGQLGVNTSLPGWNPTGPVLVTNALTAVTIGTPTEYGPKVFEGPGGFPITASPDGGNFLAMAAGTEEGLVPSIFQNMSGLSDTSQYKLSLYAKVVQDYGSSGGPIMNFTLNSTGYSFQQIRPDPGSEEEANRLYECLSGPYPGDCQPGSLSPGWILYTWSVPFPLVPNEPLGWFSGGFITPPGPGGGGGGGGPRPDLRGVWWLFDGITLTRVPEPATWAMFIGGFGMIGGQLRRRRTVAV